LNESNKKPSASLSKQPSLKRPAASLLTTNNSSKSPALQVQLPLPASKSVKKENDSSANSHGNSNNKPNNSNNQRETTTTARSSTLVNNNNNNNKSESTNVLRETNGSGGRSASRKSIDYNEQSEESDADSESKNFSRASNGSTENKYPYDISNMETPGKSKK
jgi:hypothetical protein